MPSRGASLHVTLGAMDSRNPAASPVPARQPPPAWQVWAALLVVYVVWGSTYLGIRITVETLPPFLAAGLRFAIAGAVLALVLAARGGAARLRITRRQLAGAAGVGVALLVSGNGLVMLAERQVPSGLAALVIAAVPLWVVVLRAATGERVARLTLAGVAVGFAGVGLLVLRDGLGHSASLAGMLILLVASASWATGSFVSRRVQLPADPLVSTAVQMLVAGVALVAVAFALGELRGLDAARVWAGSMVGLAYLVVFGSLVGFTAYTWLLQNAPISKVATYAYVNPVIALALGWIVLAEPVGPTILAGAGLVIVSVAAIVTRESHPAPQPAGGATVAERAPGLEPHATAPGPGAHAASPRPSRGRGRIGEPLVETVETEGGRGD